MVRGKLKNPFDAAKPALSRVFVGRVLLRRQLTEGLTTNHSFELVAGRGIGKSSLLLAVRRDLRNISELEGRKALPVYVGCRRDHRDVESILRTIVDCLAAELRTQIGSPCSTVTLDRAREHIEKRRLNNALKVLQNDAYSRGQPARLTVVLLDDLHRVSEQSLVALLSIAETIVDRRELVLLLASRHALSEEFPEAVSPFISQKLPPLAPFDLAETQSLVAKAAEFGWRVDDSCGPLAYQMTGGHPYRLHYYFYSALSTEGELTPSSLGKINTSETVKYLNKVLSDENAENVRHSPSIAAPPAKADVGILCVVADEMKAIRQFLDQEGSSVERKGLTSHRYFVESQLPAADGQHRIAVTRALEQGNRSVIPAYQAIMSEYDPTLLVLLGIGGGIHKGVDIRDVVIADSLIYYDKRAETGSGTQHRLLSYTIEAWLRIYLNRFFDNYGDVAILQGAGGLSQGHFGVHLGPIGTGEAVVKYRDAEVRKWLALLNDKALALDTEAGGVAQQFDEETLRVGARAKGYLIIRGVSDHADKAKNDNWRAIATTNAMIALKSLLNSIPQLTSI